MQPHTGLTIFSSSKVNLILSFGILSDFSTKISNDCISSSAHERSGIMAEIGLAASIIGVAAFGASVAATLYETTDNMRNANQQMRDLAKHVTHFTAVLNHMGQVLKTEKANCSEEVLRDIRKIKHSCKRTFKDIKSTVKTKHLRRVMWLLKKSKAMELEARLDSQQSMLQCIIHTLTVSKLSHIDSRYAQARRYFCKSRLRSLGLKKIPSILLV